MQIRLQILFILFFIFISSGVYAQCTGGNFGSNLNITTTQQTIAVNGNTYYTFQADSGDRYYFGSSTIQNPGEITIIDSLGINTLTHNGDFPNGGFQLIWIAPYSGLFRALTNLRPCQLSQIILGNMYYYKTFYAPFPVDSAQWSIKKFTQPNIYKTTQYKIKGDTTINGIIYSKIFSGIELNYFSPLDTLHCFVREEQRKIYIKYPVSAGYDTSEVFLYDFNLSLGDTFKVRLFNYSTDSLHDFLVETIHTYPTVTGIRTAYQLRPVNTTTVWGVQCEITFDWVEGIGSWLGPFYIEIPQYECNNGSYETPCYWENGIYLWGGGLWCDENTGIIENYNINLVNIYPNPVREILTIEWEILDLNTLEIINNEGKTLKKYNVKNQNKVYLEKSEFTPGLYLLRLIENNGNSHFKKLIIR